MAPGTVGDRDVCAPYQACSSSLAGQGIGRQRSNFQSGEQDVEAGGACSQYRRFGQQADLCKWPLDSLKNAYARSQESDHLAGRFDGPSDWRDQGPLQPGLHCACAPAALPPIGSHMWLTQKGHSLPARLAEPLRYPDYSMARAGPLL